jgi:type VI secretion system secreted protein Hcp
VLGRTRLTRSLAGGILGAPTSMANVDYFLKIDGIDGESTDAKHKNEIEVESFSWGEQNQATSSPGGGGGAGKVVATDFHYTSRLSKASPKLFLACATGEHIKKAVLIGRKAGKGQFEFLSMSFADVVVASYETTSEPSDPVPADQVGLNFARLQVSYKTQKADGSVDETIVAGFDFKANKKT